MNKVYTVIVSDEITPTLKTLHAALTGQGKVDLGKSVATRLEFTTRQHLRRAAPSRHKTANRLGATPTNYLPKRNTETRLAGNGDIKLSVFGDIFARVDGDVTVNAKPGKALAIPAIAAAYGKRPGQIGGLRLAIFTAKKKAALVMVENSKSNKPLIFKKGGNGIAGPPKQSTIKAKLSARSKGPPKPRKRIDFTVYFWLVRSVHLLQDRGLLPSDDDYHNSMKQGAVDYLARKERERFGNFASQALK